jgi:hypothetical protein
VDAAQRSAGRLARSTQELRSAADSMLHAGRPALPPNTPLKSCTWYHTGMLPRGIAGYLATFPHIPDGSVCRSQSYKPALRLNKMKAGQFCGDIVSQLRSTGFGDAAPKVLIVKGCTDQDKVFTDDCDRLHRTHTGCRVPKRNRFENSYMYSWPELKPLPVNAADALPFAECRRRLLSSLLNNSVAYSADATDTFECLMAAAAAFASEACLDVLGSRRTPSREDQVAVCRYLALAQAIMLHWRDGELPRAMEADLGNFGHVVFPPPPVALQLVLGLPTPPCSAMLDFDAGVPAERLRLAPPPPTAILCSECGCPCPEGHRIVAEHLARWPEHKGPRTNRPEPFSLTVLTSLLTSYEVTEPAPVVAALRNVLCGRHSVLQERYNDYSAICCRLASTLKYLLGPGSVCIINIGSRKWHLPFQPEVTNWALDAQDMLDLYEGWEEDVQTSEDFALVMQTCGVAATSAARIRAAQAVILMGDPRPEEKVPALLAALVIHALGKVVHFSATNGGKVLLVLSNGRKDWPLPQAIPLRVLDSPAPPSSVEATAPFVSSTDPLLRPTPVSLMEDVQRVVRFPPDMLFDLVGSHIVVQQTLDLISAALRSSTRRVSRLQRSSSPGSGDILAAAGAPCPLEDARCAASTTPDPDDLMPAFRVERDAGHDAAIARCHLILARAVRSAVRLAEVRLLLAREAATAAAAADARDSDSEHSCSSSYRAPSPSQTHSDTDNAADDGRSQSTTSASLETPSRLEQATGVALEQALAIDGMSPQDRRLCEETGLLSGSRLRKQGLDNLAHLTLSCANGVQTV